MATQKRGKNIMFFLDDEAIALSTNHTLNINPKFDEAKTKDDSIDTDVAELDYCDWSGSCDSVMGASSVTAEKTYSDLISAIISGDELEMVADAVPNAQADGDVPTAGWSEANSSSIYPKRTADCYISELNFNCAEEGNVTMSMSFVSSSVLS